MYDNLKRVVDVMASSIGLILTAPIAAAIAVAVRVCIGTPVIFRQRRPGWRERAFTCLKFRTMTDQRDSDGRLLSDQERLTRLGVFLRQTSLDELPQLWNIFRGDLSFVGPRPLCEEYLPYYTSEEHRRHWVRPGLTGWAQIHGRNHVPFDERLALDIWYVDHRSWHLDLRILLATIWIVLTRKGTAWVSFPALHKQRQLCCETRLTQTPDTDLPVRTER